MTDSVGLGINRQDGVGTSPLVYRKITASRYLSDGVVVGLAVTTRADLRYHVAEGVAVTSRGAADGRVEAYWPGGLTEPVAAGASQPRVDVVWLKAQDHEQGDPTNRVIIGVTQGTPAQAPETPDIPAGCVRLAAYTMPADATRTNDATSMGAPGHAAHRAGSMGLLGESWQKLNGPGDSTIGKHYYEMAVKFTLDSPRWIELRLDSCFSSSKVSNTDMSYRSEQRTQFRLDDATIPHTAVNMTGYWSWDTHHNYQVVRIDKGTHTVMVDSWHGYGYAPYFHYSDGDNLWCGRHFQVIDRGPAA